MSGIDGQRVTVLGGGVAGLSVACALALRGACVTVVEQAPEIAEVGAGLQISPNGMRVIAALGLGPAFEAVSLKSQSVSLRDYRRGTPVVRLDQRLVDGDFRFVHRARLIEVLEAGARDAGVDIQLGQRFTEPPQGDLVIGADGLQSIVRPVLNNSEIADFTGQVAWRTLVPDPNDAPEVQVFMGPGRHLVSYPVGRGLRNIVAVEERKEWTAEGWSHRDPPGALRNAFSAFSGPVPHWLERIDEVFLWGLFRHPVARRWHDGKRLAILGDAAHPTLPFLAQGANMALEDAWLLANCLMRLPRADALARYQHLRRDRCVRIVAAATANARNFHLSHPLVRGAAHLALRTAGALSHGRLIRRYGWIYDHDVTVEK